jgi:hypothetical protein
MKNVLSVKAFNSLLKSSVSHKSYLFLFVTCLSLFVHSQTTLCVGGTSQMTYSGSGGSWISGNTAVATVSTGGLVTATGAGSTTVNYQTSSSTNTSLYWSFESGATNPSGGVWSYTPTTTSHASLLSGFITQTGNGTHENLNWAPGAPGMVAMQRQNPSSFSYIQFVTSTSTTVSNVQFTKYHNHTIAGNYTINLQISISGGPWTNVGASVSCTAASMGSTQTVTINTTVPAGTHKIRWVRVSGSNGSDYLGLNNVSLNCVSTSASTLNSNTINVNTVPAQPSTITSPASICPNTNGTYSVTAVAGVSYTWTYSGTGTITGTGNSISLNASTGGTLTVTPSNSCGNGTARAFVVSIAALNAGAHNSAALSMCDGGNPSNLTFTTAPSGGTGVYAYQWQLNGVNISGSTSNSYDPPALTPGTYSYACKITDACGTIVYTTPKVITVTADPDAPSAIQSPSSSTVCFGTTLTLNSPVYGSNSGQTCGFEYAYSTDNGANWSTTSTTIPSFTATGTVNKIRVRVAGGCASGCSSSSWTVYSWSVTSSITSSVTPLSGNYFWRGTTSADWNISSNWYVYNGSVYTIASVVPTNSDNVIIPSNQVCVLTQPTISITTGLVKNITIETGATLTMSTGSLSVKGNWTNNGTFDPGNGSVTFNGTVAQSIAGNGTTPFTNLTINNSSTGLTLNSPVDVTNALTMTAGNVSTTITNILTLGVGSVGTLTWTSGTVVGPFRRYYANATNSGNSSGLFPIGTASDNRSTLLEYTTAPTSAGYLSAEFKAVNPASTSAGTNGIILVDQFNWQLDNMATDGYWEIIPTTLDGGTYNLKLRPSSFSSIVNTFDVCRIIKSPNAHTTWTLDGVHGTTSGTQSDFTISRTGMSGFSYFAIAYPTAAPLPVELISFQANCIDSKGVAVTWSTASEHNSANFTVEKSRDGINWFVLSEVEGAGNSTSILNYEIVDADNANGTMYYRLTQFDFDGASETFNIASVNCGSDNTSQGLKVYPNPSSDEFYIEYNNTTSEEQLELIISDLNGNTIYLENKNCEKGSNTFQLKNLTVAPGIYFIEVRIGGTISRVKHSIR